MSNHKAKFWIKSSLDLFNKYAEQIYGQIYYACQETYIATVNMWLEDNIESDAWTEVLYNILESYFLMNMSKWYALINQN